MTWLIWRQHRGELVGALVVLGALGVLLLLHGLPMHLAFDRDGIAACNALITSSNRTPDCLDDVIAFDAKYATLPQVFSNWLPLSPALVGMLVGAPLLAREYEQRTWQLVWTQGVTRTRWLVTKLAAVLAGTVAVAVAFAAGLSWWMGPTAPGGFETDVFNHTVLVFPGYVLVSVAIGILAGAVVKRTLFAAALVVPAYLAVRLFIEFVLRPRYREPLVTSTPADLVGGWVVRGTPMITDDAELRGGPIGPGSIRLLEPVGYHPADRFWAFQLIETGILLAITVALLAITWRLVLGRRSAAVSAPADPEPAISSRP